AQQVVRGDPMLVRTSNVAVLARTNAQLRPIADALADRGVGVRRPRSASGTPLQAALKDASAPSSPSALRGWAHDVLDDIAALDTARARLDAVESASSGGSDRARRAARADARSLLERVEAERAVATALLEFLRDHPRGDGAGFRSWVATTGPFDGDADDGGVELLTFHASKGREWHTVFVSGVETSLVPHKSATTAAARAEEARLLYVAMTRATDQLVLTGSMRRGGYERRSSPFLDGLDLDRAPAAPPPRELTRQRRVPDRVEAALRAWRATGARRADVLPTQWCSDRDLAAISSERPSSEEELVQVTSMGPLTARRLWPQIAAILTDTDTDSDTDTSSDASTGALATDQASRSTITGA
ncbi:MAG: 3'-5' exonuclease, partial [Actinomycetota bacterium]